MCIAIECSYKLDQKMNLNFCVNYAHFRKSGHIYIKLKSRLSVCIPLMSDDYLANRCTYRSGLCAKLSTHHLASPSLLKEVSDRCRLPSTTR